MTTTLTRPVASPADVDVSPTYSPIPMSRLLRVEWRKATDTRSARWLIGLTLLATVVVTVLMIVDPRGTAQSDVDYLFFDALALTTLLPVVSIMTMTAEWTQRTVLSTFTQEPRRRRVIEAKVVVSLLMGAIAVVSGALLTAVAVLIASSTGRDVVHDVTAATAFGFVAFVLLNMLMGVAFGALLHNTAASIVLFFLLPIGFGILGAMVHSVGRWIDPSTTFAWVQRGEWAGHQAQIAVSVLAWLVVPLVAGLIRTARREIK